MQSLKSLLIGALIAAPAMTIAQERTAGGSLNQEAAWTALRNLIDQANGEVRTVRADVNAIKACALKGMLHSPGVAGADEAGCMAPMSTSMLWTYKASSTNTNWDQFTYTYPKGGITIPSNPYAIATHKTWGNECSSPYASGKCGALGQRCYVWDHEHSSEKIDPGCNKDCQKIEVITKRLNFFQCE